MILRIANVRLTAWTIWAFCRVRRDIVSRRAGFAPGRGIGRCISEGDGQRASDSMDLPGGLKKGTDRTNRTYGIEGIDTIEISEAREGSA